MEKEGDVSCGDAKLNLALFQPCLTAVIISLSLIQEYSTKKRDINSRKRDQHSIILPESPLSAVSAPCPLLPPDHELYPGFPVVFVLASHPSCLDLTASAPPPPPPIIKGVSVPLTTNVPPPPPEEEYCLFIPPS
ncbi:hypothetical protein pdam_00019398 [Pocillopora damicornis]|uniref:Uncharacterized protein n=1 Tax=Pocillopora damicornis TaxID=46731 RepID=A0A3M6UFY6_POCDA|nr:hypothetical protein pdam_00019398 [Pocillopora damicornis]